MNLQITVAITPEYDFLYCLNSIHNSIQCNMETERDNHLPFLNIDIYRRPDSCGAMTQSENIPTLPYTSVPVCSFWRPHTGNTAIVVGRFVRLSILLWGVSYQWESPFSCFPTLFGLIRSHINRMLFSKQNMKAVGPLPRRVSGFLWFVKDDLRLRTSEICIISCEYGLV